MKRRSFFQGLCGLFALPFIKTQPEGKPYIHKLPELGHTPPRRLYETLYITDELQSDLIWHPGKWVDYEFMKECASEYFQDQSTVCGKIHSTS